MAQLIDKSTLVAEIERRRDAALTRQKNLESIGQETVLNEMIANELNRIISFIDTLEVIDPYEQCIQYASIESGIEAHAEDYSFNIESELFQQLTKEQQMLWRKEIEQACISGGYAGVELAKDPRYKEKLEVEEVDVSNISENLAEAYEYLDFTSTGNLAHNKPMVSARLKKAIRGLFDAGLFEQCSLKEIMEE